MENQMPEAKTTRTARPVADLPDEAVLTRTPPFPDLRKFVSWRLSQLNAPVHGGRIGGGAGVQAQAVRVVLDVFQSLADWMDQGCPGPEAILTEGDRQFYREAKARGITIPEDIERQL
jgi:hypothetical protein